MSRIKFEMSRGSDVKAIRWTHTKRARFTVTRKKASTLAIGDTQALRGRLSGQTTVYNILNGFESVNFIQSEKIRCVSRHQNPSRCICVTDILT